MVYRFTNTDDHLDHSNVAKQRNRSGYRSFLQYSFSHLATRHREKTATRRREEKTATRRREEKTATRRREEKTATRRREERTAIRRRERRWQLGVERRRRQLGVERRRQLGVERRRRQLGVERRGELDHWFLRVYIISMRYSFYLDSYFIPIMLFGRGVDSRKI
jgi:hypothetical protein